MMLCPECGNNTVEIGYSEDLSESYTWCTFCHWEPDCTIWREEDDDETEY